MHVFSFYVHLQDYQTYVTIFEMVLLLMIINKTTTYFNLSRMQTLK